eukprot:TRINITY_DN15409_c0_g1_i1.p1 TRINITY_DN15409_c0_g1~~TRINITY_DN15409_c0_g1_i1.p1  ORF type:complete len:334 (+),score=58.18 TRINITY_DN15409_c0_g1_i1:76-1002(+)
MDGGLATELEARGINLHPSLWSAHCLHSNPKAVVDVHLSYLQAGAQIITTASYQASLEGFTAAGLADQSDQLIRTSVDLAVEAKHKYLSEVKDEEARFVFVAASVGPYGAILHDGSEYTGSYMATTTPETIKQFHKRRIQILATHPGTDMILVETQPSSVEACLILDVISEVNKDIPVLICFSCCDDAHTCSGEDFGEAVARIDKYDQVVSIGVNCCSPLFISPLLDIAKSVTSKPLVIYPNSGEDWDHQNRSWVEIDSERVSSNFQELLSTWVEKGAKIIGGCCRTSPATIAAINKSSNELFQTLKI